ncbi:Uncharacterised protein [Legionella sainthelensi]|nr:Uncharacterised protein [Legionella sainthelensi]
MLTSFPESGVMLMRCNATIEMSFRFRANDKDLQLTQYNPTNTFT